MTPVHAAMALANADEDGAGYWLVLTLRSGVQVRGSAHRPEGDLVRLDVLHEGENETRPTIVRCSEVAAAEIEW